MLLYSSIGCTLFILFSVSRFGYIRTSRIFVDEGPIVAAYEDVRNDNTKTNWAVLTYEGKKVKFAATGVEHSEFLSHMTVGERVYGYLRVETGDVNNRRAMFAFITWIGPSVSPLKKARVSTDKAFVKNLWPQFGKEILADEKSELQYNKIKKALEAASGADYGTGRLIKWYDIFSYNGKIFYPDNYFSHYIVQSSLFSAVFNFCIGSTMERRKFEY